MNIALIGYRGTGKTSVAQQLALLLGWHWVDSDVEVELLAGKSIASIFADSGELVFRDLEQQVVAELAARERTVLALGGGAVMRHATREILQSLCRIVWLQASPETIQRRIRRDPVSAAQRPDLTSHGGLKEIETVLAQRLPVYRGCAEVEVDTENLSPKEVAAEIVARLGLAHARGGPQ